jgi:hypothetical protein
MACEADRPCVGLAGLVLEEGDAVVGQRAGAGLAVVAAVTDWDLVCCGLDPSGMGLEMIGLLSSTRGWSLSSRYELGGPYPLGLRLNGTGFSFWRTWACFGCWRTCACFWMSANLPTCGAMGMVALYSAFVMVAEADLAWPDGFVALRTDVNVETGGLVLSVIGVMVGPSGR